jgi:hypothetical protein
VLHGEAGPAHTAHTEPSASLASGALPRRLQQGLAMDRATRALGWLDPEPELSCMGWRAGPLDAAITDGCGAGGGGGGRSGGVDGTLGAGAGGGGCDGAAGMRDSSGVSSGPFGTCAGWPACVRMS